jgi:hypothetical protein
VTAVTVAAVTVTVGVTVTGVTVTVGVTATAVSSGPVVVPPCLNLSIIKKTNTFKNNS